MYHTRLLCICMLILIRSRDHCNAHGKLIRRKRKDHANMIDYREFATSTTDLQRNFIGLPDVSWKHLSCWAVGVFFWCLLGVEGRGLSLVVDGWMGVRYPCGTVMYGCWPIQTEVQTHNESCVYITICNGFRNVNHLENLIHVFKGIDNPMPVIY